MEWLVLRSSNHCLPSEVSYALWREGTLLAAVHKERRYGIWMWVKGQGDYCRYEDGRAFTSVEEAKEYAILKLVNERIGHEHN